jgi:hypothetical protein
LLAGSRVPRREVSCCSPEVPEALGVLKRRRPHGLRLGIPYGLLPWECLISKMGDTGVVCVEFGFPIVSEKFFTLDAVETPA